MLKIGLIREGKVPADNRVALTPAHCRWLKRNHPEIRIVVQHCSTRCFSDKEYLMAGIEVREDMSDCDILMGIKEVPAEMLIAGKTYLFFSHTKKLQPYNQELLRKIIEKEITLIDYECLEHPDGKRIIGFGFFAGIVGAHNGMMAYGTRTKAFHLDRINGKNNFQQLIYTYFGLKLPNIKIAVTGNGRVAHGILEIMNLLEIHEADANEFLTRQFSYPVYIHLKGADLYEHKSTGKYSREDFHLNPGDYNCVFKKYLPYTDILMNGIYWQKAIPRLFDESDIQSPEFKIQTIADITDDVNGSVPCNMGDSTIKNPIYGIDKKTLKMTLPYSEDSLDIMAVGNLPNELPRDASRYFGEQLIKYILKDLIEGNSEIIDHATIVKGGNLTAGYEYMRAYAEEGRR